MDILKDHKELYDKTNEHLEDKAIKGCLWEQFVRSQVVGQGVHDLV